MNRDDDDAVLVAFIDKELDESARRAVDARLAADADFRARLALLQEGGRPFAPAFQALLDEAPVHRLQASFAERIDREERLPTPIRGSLAWRMGRLGVAASVILFCAGILIGHYGPSWFARSGEMVTRAADHDDDWRQAVAEYMSLYTRDTFVVEPASQDIELTTLSAKIDVALTPERLVLANLQFRGAQIFGFQGAPLVQLGYVDPTTGPVLFCIIHNFEADAAMKAERRGGFAVASWARAGRGYMLIGRLSPDQTADLAHSLETRF
jgi:anti-sigma factor RsiW